MEESTDKITNRYIEILLANGISDLVSNIVVEDSGLEGEGFMSITKCVTVKFKDSDTKPPLHLFVKEKSTEDKEHLKMVDDMMTFEKETVFYMKYVPAAIEFCNEKGNKNLACIYPKCYYGDDSFLVFENLVKGKEFVLLDKAKQQNFEEASMSLTALAKHHAISYAFIRHCGGSKEFFKQFPYLDFEGNEQNFQDVMGPMHDNLLDTNVSILEKSSLEGTSEVIKKLQSFKGKTMIRSTESIKVKPGDLDFLVLAHGDYWNNNMMFKKDSDGIIIDHVILDMQTTRYASPAVDLGNLLFTSVKFQVRRKRLKDLLKVYVDELNETLFKLGETVRINYDEMFMEFKRKFEYGFWNALDFVTGPGTEMFKDLQSNNGMEDMTRKQKELLSAWIQNNPDKCNSSGKMIMELMEEFDELLL